MNKGVLIMILAGVGFMYLVTSLVDQAESTTSGRESGQTRKAKEHAQYYQKDVNGDDVLNFMGVSLSKAKTVWGKSTIKDKVLGYFPDFDTMKQIVDGRLSESDFKTFLLKRFKKIEGDYLGGTVDLEQTRRALENIR